MPVQLPFQLRRRSSPVSAPAIAANAQAQPAPKRLTAAQQWTRLTGVLQAAISGAEHARRRQTAATQQLDLAQYALYTLGDELAAVMTIPGRREPASVHVLAAPSASAKSKARAA